MRDGITRLTFSQIEKRWSEKVKQEYEGLNSARDIQEFLSSPGYTVTFRYALCRFIRERYGKKKKEDPKVSIVSYADFCAEFSEGMDTPLPEEIDDYAELMVRLARDRGMKEEIQGKLLRKYLDGRQENVSRDTLFRLAFAFDMDCEYVCELLETLSEIPYNFRRPEECIYYFCQYSEEHNNWQSAQELLRWYYEGEKESAETEPELQAGQSRMMEEQIALILNEEEDPEEQKRTFMRYLDSRRQELRGYSLSSYHVLDELLDEMKELTNAEDDTDLAIKLWEPIWVQYYTKKADRTGVNRSDFVPFKDILNLPKTIYEKPLWRARIRKLRRRSVPVEKRDILFLNCVRWALEEESEGGKDALQEFILETNDMLLECGLSVIYPPNAYDRMILLAICSGSPYDILGDLFQVAADEEKLRRLCENG